MKPHPDIANCWILHPTKNPIDHPVSVDEESCRTDSGCPSYAREWEFS